jgi:hypothetical protein
VKYTLLKLFPGGTFTTGISLDWRTQFGGATIVQPHPTIAGLFDFPGVQTTYGVYGAILYKSSNPCDKSICIAEASVGHPVQVYFNESLIEEVTVPKELTISEFGGFNKLEVVRDCSPLIVVPAGPLVDPTNKFSGWTSTYSAGADPFIPGDSGPIVSDGRGTISTPPGP